MKGTKYLSKLAEKMVRDILAIIAMLACTSICLGNGNTITISSDLSTFNDRIRRRVFPSVAGNSAKPNGTWDDNNIFPLDPNDNTLIIKEGASVGEASGAYINANSPNFESMTGNKVIVNGGNFNGHDINGACALDVEHDVNVNGNTVEINAGENVGDVCGGRVEGNGNAKNNNVIINGVRVEGVFGGCVGNGNAENNEVIINGGKIRGDVFGGFVGGDDNGNATGNRVTIAGTTEFGNRTILCGGICANNTSDAFTGNTLIIKETKGITVKGISNFENYEFYLSQVKPQEPVLTARDGGCGWDSPACPVKLSRNNITVCSKSSNRKRNKTYIDTQPTRI